ncbi:exodeoxyribonuclease V subunit alpha [Thalassotalea sp. Y01]|uniref:exodeoxyribonuclease V subunit alpha n=1 Tax=Thalassotalea sp. Y01 TaxID=2729613 RepID=UPI00145E6990|nr:exodeoxyribonuclease V subunit alpha [Thalassotalea sp. Y01]NMP17417.1 exodeoxyribonuclease V subunit alpha [Thalassotalea sp. Y01]
MTLISPFLQANKTSLPYDSYYQASEQLADIEAIDYYLACSILDSLKQRITAHTQTEISQLFHVFMALSSKHRSGHSCVRIRDLANRHEFIDAESDSVASTPQSPKTGFVFADFTSLHQLLEGYFNRDNDSALICYANENLYLRRYWRFESEVANFIERKRKELVAVDVNDCQRIIATLFEQSTDDIDWQAVSVANAMNKSLAIIAGGPGTGKTYTVTKLLLALLMLDDSLQIDMIAPTGKAAQRLSESIANAVNGFRQSGQFDEGLMQRIPEQAATIHRLLGVIPNSVNFKFNEDNKLTTDVLLIDEVSMVDLAMMCRVFRALKDGARVIMLGDANQLPSVATGSVLADIAPFGQTQLSATNVAFLRNMSANFNGLTESKPALDYLCYLTQSRRFSGDGGIGKLASMMIDSKAESAWQLVSGNQDGEVSLAECKNFNDFLYSLIKRHYLALFSAETVEQAFAALDRFRILTPSRKGEQGVELINEYIEHSLQRLGVIDDVNKPYHGKPIMISENHYTTGLFNGDIGLIWQQPGQPLVAYFPEQSNFRRIPLARLPAYETVYAMTIHKTQGSEFANVAMVLSEGQQRLLSRELLYTGITRAKRHIELYCQKSVFTKSVSIKVSRASGLTKRILKSIEDN